MNEMSLTPPLPEPTPPVVAHQAPASRSRMLTIGLPAVIAVTALGAATFVLSAGADNSVRTGDVATTTTTTTVVDGDVFTSAGVSVETSAPATTATPTTAPATTPVVTTAATTTAPPTTAPPTTAAPTTAPVTLPEQPTQPIAPPQDTRGWEEEIRVGGISIPKLGVDEPLFSGIRLTTLDKGPGHWPGTALPGEVGNVVVAAHRTSHGGPFRNIDQLVAGDTVMFSTDAGDVEYVVTGTQIVNPDAIWIVDPTDTPTATLFACHPPGSVAQRIVVNLELRS